MGFDLFKLFKSSSVAKPSVPTHDKLAQATVLKDQGQLDAAGALCARLMELAPGHVEIRVLLAEIESGRGHAERAIELYTDVVALDPRHATAYYRRGNLRKDRAEFESALADYDRATELDPKLAKAFCNRGVVLGRLGRSGAALESYDKALALNPSDSLSLFNRSAVLRELNQHHRALESYGQAIAVQPDYVECRYNRALLLIELKIWNAALEDLNMVIVRLPNFAEAYFYRGKVRVSLRHQQLALEDFDRVLASTPDHANALHSRANLLYERRLFAAAIASYDKVIQLEPDRVDAFVGRGLCLQNLRQFESAIASFDRALELNPDRRYLLGMRRHAQMQVCDWEQWDQDLALLADGLNKQRAISTPHALLALIDSPRLHRLAAAAWVEEECPANDILGPLEPRRPGDKIRVGYFSADFREHPVSLLTAELFEMHDRSKFDLTAFSFGPGAGDPIRSRLEKAFDRFIDVTDRSDVEVATAARALDIDIAVDLSGFTESARSGIFALRAAPLQVNYLGYPGTMGADFIDYIIGDSIVVPEGSQQHFTEKVVRLPHSYLPNDSTRSISTVVHTREAAGLPVAAFVFCCFNNSYKINPEVFGIWMRVLKRADNSVLWLSRNNTVAERNLRHEASRRGVDPDRLVFADRLISLPEHLARYRLADLFLDTFPYNAHATAIDALWAGLPVLTRTGASFASRAGASLVRALELPELATATPEEYEHQAVRLASNAALMHELRTKLAHARSVTPLFDTVLYTKNLEMLYAQIYAAYHADLP